MRKKIDKIEEIQSTLIPRMRRKKTDFNLSFSAPLRETDVQIQSTQMPRMETIKNGF
ncbi:MAG: hypothetical protein ACHQFW_04505 [Chitinophagales bacterium]